MTVYSIKDLEKLSGIKAHTIRVWEQRYKILMPQRTKTNIRYYKEEDLKRLLNVALLNKNGIKISKIAKMTPQQMMEHVSEYSKISFQDSTQVDILTLSMIEMDEYKFNRIIETNIKQLGFEQTIETIIYPFLDKLGLLWLTGSIKPVQEHFITYLIRQKVIVEIEKLPMVNNPDAKQFLVYLPEGENQELSILLMQYYLKARGHKVSYLGLNISLDDLRDAHHIRSFDFLYTMITESYAEYPVQKYINRLSAFFPDTTLLLSGYQVVTQHINLPENATILESFEHALAYIETVK